MSSPPSTTAKSPDSTALDLEARLDHEILHIRKEIARLRAHKQRLSSALLGSSRVQKQLLAPRTSRSTVTSIPTPTAKVAHGQSSSGTSTAGVEAEDGASQNESLTYDLARLQKHIDLENRENDIKIHRLAFGVTAFPLNDIAPERRSVADSNLKTMLGLRFDLHPTRAELTRMSGPLVAGKEINTQNTLVDSVKDEDGEVDEDVSKYFILLRKLRHHDKIYLKVHQHNIPGHIDVGRLEREYLALPNDLLLADGTLRNADEEQRDDNFQDDSGIDVTQDIILPGTDNNMDLDTTILPVDYAVVTTTDQNLPKFTASLHTLLRSWYYRLSSFYHLRDTLNLDSTSADGTKRGKGKYGVRDIICTNDARHIQIHWHGDELALLKVGSGGLVERAVVYGSHECEAANRERIVDRVSAVNVRLYSVERKLMRTEQDERVKVSELADRLKIVESDVAGEVSM